ncbi:trehalose-phosphatase [Mesorhizobium sp. YIM 152430]|uniref:trehalose-phosphatase n=1 Tax=Mesorhizobium sp. YIM 152430 TaxID=3031761 RepID=UPI0023DBFD52|nr:trehalose-phosphatase [Mesorhizobium sp. YIM 152430]MDF1599843.1 trehalose-phosphatase [Mesorhizobium sp. YIM 152430]
MTDLGIPCAPERLAVFLDFDGTLADIVDHPDDVHLPPKTAESLARLESRTSGAVAIVTGRPIAQIDALVAPLILPVAGVHGMSRRSFDGTLHNTKHDATLFAEAQARLTRLHLDLSDTMIEVKPASVAFHYRRRPDLAGSIAEKIHDVLGDLEGLDILHGKMVVEVKAGHAHKGDAIRAFMAEKPFAGRVPLFAGDDVTDEFGFAAMREFDGIAIKIGPGETAAGWRADDPDQFRIWLDRLAVFA